MATKYYYTVKVCYNGVCIWKERVSNKTKYVILRLIRAMRRVDTKWAAAVKEDD